NDHWRHVFAMQPHSVETKHDGNKTIRILGNRRLTILAALKKYGLDKTLSDTKFIPKELLNTSIKHRTALLQGLIDTDGYVDARGQIYYCSTSPQLRKDVKWLVGSLGGVATEFDDNELYIKLPDDISPCRLPRKLARLRPRNCTIYK